MRVWELLWRFLLFHFDVFHVVFSEKFRSKWDNLFHEIEQLTRSSRSKCLADIGTASSASLVVGTRVRKKNPWRDYAYAFDLHVPSIFFWIILLIFSESLPNIDVSSFVPGLDAFEWVIEDWVDTSVGKAINGGNVDGSSREMRSCQRWEWTNQWILPGMASSGFCVASHSVV